MAKKQSSNPSSARRNASDRAAAGERKQGDGQQHAEEVGETVDFETAMAEIEQIVAQLEGGELGLAESLAQYERAVGRLRTCHRLLDEAEHQVTLLSGFDADGNPVVEPFDEERSSDLEEKQRSRSRRRGAAASRSGPPGSTDRGNGDGPGEGSVDDLPGLF